MVPYCTVFMKQMKIYIPYKLGHACSQFFNAGNLFWTLAIHCDPLLRQDPNQILYLLTLPPPPKINMEPKNHPIEQENHLPSTSIFGFQPFIFQDVV